MSLEIPGVFITGTDTDVGKTFVSALICRQLRSEGLTVGAYKPACSGASVSEEGPIWQDIEVLYQATGARFDRQRICPQRFIKPLAPPISAREANVKVDPDLLRSGARWWEKECDFLVIEGAGGWHCPLTETETIADLAVDFDFPVLIVARATLGTINHTHLTIESVRARNCRICGVVINQGATEVDPWTVRTNSTEISTRTGVPVVATIPHFGSGQEIDITVNWQDIFRRC